MLVHLALRDTLRFGTTVENEKIASNVAVALPPQFSPLPVKVEHSRLLLAPCIATKRITENRNSCHFIVPSL